MGRLLREQEGTTAAESPVRGTKTQRPSARTSSPKGFRRSFVETGVDFRIPLGHTEVALMGADLESQLIHTGQLIHCPIVLQISELQTRVQSLDSWLAVMGPSLPELQPSLPRGDNSHARLPEQVGAVKVTVHAWYLAQRLVPSASSLLLSSSQPRKSNPDSSWSCARDCSWPH